MERLSILTKKLTRSTTISDGTDYKQHHRMYLTQKPNVTNHNEVEPIDEAQSPDPPNLDELKIEEKTLKRIDSNLRFQLNKDCPICLTLMTEPCRFPKQLEACDHMICKGCMEAMCEQASQKIFTLDNNYRSISITCPFCRAYSIINLDGNQDYVQVDKEHQALLREVFEDEFRMHECCQDVDEAHSREYNQCYRKYKNENCILNFEIGIRETKKAGVVQWQEYVKITNPEYNQIIDKIISQVDFCINLTNYGGIKNPIVHKTNDQFFRNEKRKLIKDRKQVEIAMVPLGGKHYATQMPDYLPVKLYFNKIKGLKATVREVVHDNLKSGQNRTIKFSIHAQKKAIDNLL